MKIDTASQTINPVLDQMPGQDLQAVGAARKGAAPWAAAENKHALPFDPPVVEQPPLPGSERMLGGLIGLLKSLIALLKQLLSAQGADGNKAAGRAGGTGKVEKGDPVDGPGGFVFKPVSESNGNLVVLAPKDLTGDIENAVIRDASGKVLEEVDLAGVANGDREHFRFSKPGADYPDNITVELQMKDGSVKSFAIEDPSKRYD